MTFEIQHDRPLASLNTLGLKVNAEHLVIARSEPDIIEALAEARRCGWPVTVLGGGSNVVLTRDVPGLTLVVAIPGMSFDGTRVTSGAGEGWHTLVLASLEQGLCGLENLSLIPGSVGAAPIQNIGCVRYGTRGRLRFAHWPSIANRWRRSRSRRLTASSATGTASSRGERAKDMSSPGFHLC
ncbi:MAG: FAD-binding protein [Gammaproteobacteria bacterium]|nr:FAD-binding protein [Gammaproteobacteria bacterium]